MEGEGTRDKRSNNEESLRWFKIRMRRSDVGNCSDDARNDCDVDGRIIRGSGEDCEQRESGTVTESQSAELKSIHDHVLGRKSYSPGKSQHNDKGAVLLDDSRPDTEQNST